MATTEPGKKSVKNLVIGVGKYAIGFGLLAFMIWRNWEGKPSPDPERAHYRNAGQSRPTGRRFRAGW